MTLTEQIVAEVERAAEDTFAHPSAHDRAVVLSLMVRGAQIALDYVKSSGMAGDLLAISRSERL
jgi:hypothetical protein